MSLLYQAFDDASVEPPPTRADHNDKQRKALEAFEAMRTMETDSQETLHNPSLPVSTEEVFLYHSANAPHTRTVYDPTRDAEETQMAIVHCEAAEGETPWDCVRIDKIHEVDGTFDATHLEPYTKKGYIRHNVLTWPANWYDQRLVPAKFYGRSGKGKNVRLLEKESVINLDSVQFSTFLTKIGKIKKNMLKHVQEAISACEKGTRNRQVAGLDDAYDDDVE